MRCQVVAGTVLHQMDRPSYDQKKIECFLFSKSGQDSISIFLNYQPIGFLFDIYLNRNGFSVLCFFDSWTMRLDFVNFLRTVPMHTEGNIELISDVDNDGVTLQKNSIRLLST